MSNWFNGPQGKGYMRRVRRLKREQAETRNAGGSTMQLCGHRHGPLQVSRCEFVESGRRS